MVDGRSMYTPTFGGVKWESLHVPIEDIERIEVIRGPGATVWGANAMNGVINILTRSTADTEGTLVSAGTGSEEHAFGTVRQGGKVGDRLGYRLSAGYLDRDDTLRWGEHDSSSNQGRVGTVQARFDWTPSEQDRVTFVGGYFTQGLRTSNYLYEPHPMIPGLYAGQSVVHSEHENWGGNGGFTWTRALAEDHSIELAGYVDVEKSDTLQVGETRRTVDLTLQDNRKLSEESELVWGLGWRQNDSRTDEGAPGLYFQKENRREVIWSGFAQLESVLVPDLLTATVGSKVEWNDITGWELQPSARMLWTPNDWNQAWASVSRSVRTPTRADRDVRLIAAVFPAGPGMYAPFTIEGSGRLDSEVMLAYEIGYRVQPSSKVSIDTAVFLNDYENMIMAYTVLGPTSLSFDNRTEARVYGAEVEATWQVMNDWRVTGSWTGQRVQERGLRRNEGMEGDTPRHQMQIHSYLNVTDRIELDLGVHYMGRRAFVSDFGSYRIGSHWRTDLRLGWKPCARMEVAVGVQDLFDRRHSEFRGEYVWPAEIQQVEIQRNVYGQVRWTF
jgi:iron complex outermembrane receptor protein